MCKRLACIIVSVASIIILSPIAMAQFWDSWTNTYSPTWTPLSLDQMTSRTDTTWKINTYQPSTSSTATTSSSSPSDLLIPEGGKAVRISKAGTLRYLDDGTLLTFGSKVNFDTKEITFLKDYITFKVGVITHYNVGSDSFGYVHPSRFEIDTEQYRKVSDAVKAPGNFTVPAGTAGVRIKEWGDVQYLNNNMRVSGAKGNFSSSKIVDALDATKEIGEITINQYKQYDNVDSFGYIYPVKLWYAFYNNNGKDEFGLPLPPAGFTVPEGMLGVRIGDWGSVYYLKDNTLVSQTAFGKLKEYTYNAATKEMVPATKFNIVDIGPDGMEKEIGAITHYIQDADIYSYGYAFPPAGSTAPVDASPENTPSINIPSASDMPLLPFRDIPESASYFEAILYAFQNNWIPSASKFKPNSAITRCQLNKMISKASGKPYAKSKCKKVLRKTLQSLLQIETGMTSSILETKPRMYVKKSEAVMALYEVFVTAN